MTLVFIHVEFQNERKDAAEVDELDQWSDKILDAERLVDVFGDAPRPVC